MYLAGPRPAAIAASISGSVVTAMSPAASSCCASNEILGVEHEADARLDRAAEMHGQLFRQVGVRLPHELETVRQSSPPSPARSRSRRATRCRRARPCRSPTGKRSDPPFFGMATSSRPVSSSAAAVELHREGAAVIKPAANRNAEQPAHDYVHGPPSWNRRPSLAQSRPTRHNPAQGRVAQGLLQLRTAARRFACLPNALEVHLLLLPLRSTQVAKPSEPGVSPCAAQTLANPASLSEPDAQPNNASRAIAPPSRRAHPARPCRMETVATGRGLFPLTTISAICRPVVSSTTARRIARG